MSVANATAAAGGYPRSANSGSKHDHDHTATTQNAESYLNENLSHKEEAWQALQEDESNYAKGSQ